MNIKQLVITFFLTVTSLNSFAQDDQIIHFDQNQLEISGFYLSEASIHFSKKDRCNWRCRRSLKKFIVSFEDLSTETLGEIDRPELLQTLMSMTLTQASEYNSRHESLKVQSFFGETNLLLNNFYENLERSVKRRRNWRYVRASLGVVVAAPGAIWVAFAATGPSVVVLMSAGEAVAVTAGLTASAGSVYFISSSIDNHKSNIDLLRHLQESY